MFTAAEAKRLAGESLEEKVAKLGEAIKVAATNKKRQLRTGWEYKDDKDLWIQGGYKPTEDWTKAKKMLELAGYTVDFYYSDGSIAVDMYTIIKW